MENQEKPDLGTRIENSITNLFNGADGSLPTAEQPATPSNVGADISPKLDIADENNLKMVAGVILGAGIISSLILFSTLHTFQYHLLHTHQLKLFSIGRDL
jgi:hypothetical protein